MKKAIISCLLSILSIGTWASDYQYLVFTLSDGTQQSVTASDLTITFSDGNLVATSGSTTLATIALTSLTSMEFSNETTGIDNIESSLTIDDAAAIYDMGGRLMPRNAQLPKGVYVMKTNNKTIKFQVK